MVRVGSRKWRICCWKTDFLAIENVKCIHFHKILLLPIEVKGGDKMAKEVDCKSAGIDCPFMLRTESDDELVSVTQQHVKKIHKKDVSRQDILKMARKV